MSNKKLGQLAIVAAIMVVWAVLQSHLANRPSAESAGPAYLIQGMDPAEIASITLGHGENEVTIVNNDGQFVVTNKANYPVDPKQINDLLTKCFDLKTKELYTDKAKNHEALEVTEDNARSIVKFYKADGSLLTGVIVGKSPESGSSAYVRRVDSDEVYLADNVPWFRTSAVDYLNQEIVTVEADDVNNVTVTTPEGAYALTPGRKSSDVVMVDMPAGKTLKKSDAKSVLTALTSLRFDDVNTPPTDDPNAVAAVKGLDFNYRYICRLNNKTEYTLDLAKTDDGKTYARCSAAYFGEKVMINPAKVDSDEERREKEARLLAEEHYQRFNLRHKGWVYQLPEWKAKNLTMKQVDLLEEVKVETPEAPVEPEPMTVEPNAPVEPNVPAKPEPEAIESVAPPVEISVVEPTPVVEPNQLVQEPNEVAIDPNQVIPDPNEPPADPNAPPVVE